MDPQQPVSQTPIYQESPDKSAKWLWLIILLVVIGALVFAFVRGIGPFAGLNPFSGQGEASPTPTSSPFSFTSPSPVATTSATRINKAEAKIRVLNGSGKAGMASVVKEFLESKGYKVTSIGNADSFDFAQTVIRFKQTFKNFQEALLVDLSDKYSVKVSGDALEATDSADIEVIAGSK